MTSEDGEKQPSPFTRPGFIAAAGVVALIVVCAIILVIVNLSRGSSAPAPTPTGTSSATTAPSTPAASGDASVCGLGGVELSGTVTAAPDATWKYEGTMAYPTSPDYGPGKTDPAGFRYCFQHSPTGALFMAANAFAQGSTGADSKAWSEYVFADGPYRTQLLAQAGTQSSTTGTRSSIQGFRVLNYDGKTASIDLAVSVSTPNGTTTVSGVYSLVWSDGDWKVSTDTATPLDVAPIPNVAGYTSWGEG
ncbi:MAG: hypothetical protein CMH84_00710 [Nocardioides sp.]|jgi:hypothetical protein|uniref:DUF8175 domain-containing protein n=1 Tax=Microbacterium ginsengisoli TaxID=400772 RepID=A0A0F0LXX6_9MICO|nr:MULTISPECIES: hypothetical protein [Micrococcales]KJL40883.1 hypothetical protein RR49_00386 [Microbacterium ginsengisoli]MAY95049.1 hypothetical protein [Nocardioides sp.]MEA1265143.1 hypothetical protein [Microbacterium sp. STF-2]MEE2524365.1 hypothetical protein [Pseudarthrobacter sp. J47]